MALTGVPPAAFMRTGDLADPRAQRTRALLLAEFERQLALTGQVPTVASLVREAGVSRSAFYCHFTSIEELGIAAVRTALDELGERDTAMRRANDLSGASVTRMTYGAFFAHIAGHRHLYATLVAAAGDGSARDELREALVRQTQQSIEAVPGRPERLDSRRAAAFVIGGVLAVLSEWLADPDPCSPHELAEAITALMPPWLVGSGNALPALQVDVGPQTATSGDITTQTLPTPVDIAAQKPPTPPPPTGGTPHDHDA
ncbi:TetR/AcrR family transcriptional regulator [Nonomuraea sp. 10N515B]|uniref:TetR/AcrR family transcriptional regulator n=1 Tax=Nonomuraea sp. 10N515B TaxID=3457422 RepID=UPI003FCEA71F